MAIRRSIGNGLGPSKWLDACNGWIHVNITVTGPLDISIEYILHTGEWALRCQHPVQELLEWPVIKILKLGAHTTVLHRSILDVNTKCMNHLIGL